MPFQRFIDDMADIPSLILPMLHYPTSFHSHGCGLPGLLHANLNQSLRVIIFHVRLGLGESSHIAKAVNSPTHRPFRQGILRALGILELQYQRRLWTPVEISVQQRVSSSLGPDVCACAFAM